CYGDDLYRDFIYIDDIVESIERLIPNASSEPVRYKVFNIGNNYPEKLMTFIHALEQALSHSLGREIEFKKEYEPNKPGDVPATYASTDRSEEHTSELQSRFDLVCRLLLEKKKKKNK